MANNCYNFIEINGNEQEIKEFLSHLELNDTQEDGSDIYSNLITKFCGVRETTLGDGNAKWFDMEIDTVEQDKTYIKIFGDSAWSPSLVLFIAISEKYPSFKIRYEYEEQGYDFSGWADIENGQMEDHTFAYWEGLVAMNYSSALESVIANELDCYETEEELIESDMYKAFGEDEQKEILTNYNIY